ncbi:MAG TPA: hypothetical protein VG708_02045 [Mycobacteriales bacterium]|jgi:hypothetical protein|nr:hypothetical protein [Mycobacteriales bacterium]
MSDDEGREQRIVVPTPYLRRTESRGRGRTALIVAAIFFVLLIVAVLVPLVVIGLHNNGAKIPPTPLRSSVTAHP